MQAKLITLKNKFIEATFTNYGARITGLITPDKHGKPVDVVAGFATVNDYIQATSAYYGPTIGRYANRIAGGKFILNGVTYQLPINNGPNCLHGGGGLHSKVWEITAEQEDRISMRILSPDGEDGFPGDLEVRVTFTIKDKDWIIDYEAATTKDTVINLTNHAYFNLNGEGAGNISGHYMQINADSYTPVDANLIPTGDFEAVANTPFDFRQPETIGQRIDADNEQIKKGSGYDHNYVLNKNHEHELSLAAKATGEKSGVVMKVLTTEPGMQFYTGNFMDGTNIFKGGAPDSRRTTFALETQHFPDSPNQPDFPSTLLKPGSVFKSTTIYRFGVE